MDEVMKKLIDIEKMLIRLSPEMGMSFICTTFDFICEYHGLDKTKTMKILGREITKINEERGPMMGAESYGEM